MSAPRDVLIVGARPAGSTLARLFAERGCHVLVCERSARGADTLSTHALMRGAVAHLHRHGLLDAVIASGTPAVTRTTFRYGGVPTSIDIVARDGVSALYAPRRHVLDPLLADAAVAAGAEVRYGVRVVALSRNGHGVVDGVVIADAQDRRETIHAALVVGADGRRDASRGCGRVIPTTDRAPRAAYAAWPRRRTACAERRARRWARRGRPSPHRVRWTR